MLTTSGFVWFGVVRRRLHVSTTRRRRQRTRGEGGAQKNQAWRPCVADGNRVFGLMKVISQRSDLSDRHAPVPEI